MEMSTVAACWYSFYLALGMVSFKSFRSMCISMAPSIGSCDSAHGDFSWLVLLSVRLVKSCVDWRPTELAACSCCILWKECCAVNARPLDRGLNGAPLCTVVLHVDISSCWVLAAEVTVDYFMRALLTFDCSLFLLVT